MKFFIQTIWAIVPRAMVGGKKEVWYIGSTSEVRGTVKHSVEAGLVEICIIIWLKCVL